MVTEYLYPVKHTVHADADPDLADRHALLAYAMATGDTLALRIVAEGVDLDGLYQVTHVDAVCAPNAACVLLSRTASPEVNILFATQIRHIQYAEHRKVTAGHTP